MTTYDPDPWAMCDADGLPFDLADIVLTSLDDPDGPYPLTDDEAHDLFCDLTFPAWPADVVQEVPAGLLRGVPADDEDDDEDDD